MSRRQPAFRVESLEDRDLMTGMPTNLAGHVVGTGLGNRQVYFGTPTNLTGSHTTGTAASGTLHVYFGAPGTGTHAAYAPPGMASPTVVASTVLTPQHKAAYVAPGLA